MRAPRALLAIVALLVMGGLLIRTVVNVVNLDAGFDPDRLVTASVPPIASNRSVIPCRPVP